MVNLKVDGRRYNIDGNPTIEQWTKLMKWDFESPVHWQYIIEAVTGLPFYVINDMLPEQQRLAVTLVAHAISERKVVPLPNFDEISFGTFVDMEYLISLGTAVGLQDMVDKLGVNHEHVQEALFVIERYIQWRNNIFKQYTGLFGLNDKADEGDAKPMKPREVAGSWYRVLVELSNDDILKVKDIVNLQVKEVLNFMAIRKEKQLAELQAIKQQQRKNDVQRTRR